MTHRFGSDGPPKVLAALVMKEEPVAVLGSFQRVGEVPNRTSRSGKRLSGQSFQFAMTESAVVECTAEIGRATRHDDKQE
jgi:hypothetical protein